MNLKNCIRCGRVYAYDGFSICQQCRRDDEEDFRKVKEYLNENPGANVAEVSEATGVDAKKIIQFLKDGRLEVRDENNLLLDCERCGKPIRTGRFCEKCSLEMQRELNQAISRKDPNNIPSGKIKERMRIVDKYRKR